MDKFAQKYVDEASEIIVKLESLILEVENDRENIEIINEIFRLMHTLKGGGAMFGFDTVTDVTHHLESIYDLIRNKKAKITKELLDASLDIIDYVKLIISESSELEEINHKEKVENLIQLKEKFKINNNGYKKVVAEKKKIEKKQPPKEETKKKTTELKTVEKKKTTPTKKTVKKKNIELKIKPNSINSYQIFFKPHIDTLKNGTDPLLLIREITELGICRIFSVNNYVPELTVIKYDELFLAWFIILVTDNKNAIDDVFIFVEDEAIIEIKTIASGNVFENEKFVDDIDFFVEEEIRKLKKIHSKDLNDIRAEKIVESTKDNKTKIEKTKIKIEEETEKTEEKTETIIEEEDSFGFFDDNEYENEENVENKAENEKIETKEVKQENQHLENEIEFVVEQNANDYKYIKSNDKSLSKQKTTISSLRVSAEKVDTLMNLVSELITTQASLSVFVENQTNAELELITENLQKLSRQLRDNAFELSMIPLQSVVIRFQRLIRDLSRQLNKDIEFKTKGTSTELDKRIIENLIDPIMHLIRNCIDHGIETKEERLKSGKSETGTVFLNAYYSGTNVFLQVGDDGKGIDIEKIKTKAIEKGFFDKKTKYKRGDILDVLFEPGFSTVKQISEVSGRGVGLDVVKRKISELRGEIKTETKEGKGTTFTIKLPLTLSIIDGLLIIIGTTRYVIPLNVVNKIYPIAHSELKKSHYNIIVLDNKQIPYYYLREEFDEKSKTPEKEQVLVINYEDKLVGIVVDEVIGEYQAVLKTLGKLYHKQQIFSGATILGDGIVALVVDVRKIIDELST